MDTKQKNNLKLRKCDNISGEMLYSGINMNEVRDFTKKLTENKKEILENSFDEIKKLTKELNDLKLQNEEMEVVLQDVMKDKEHVENSYEVLSSSYDALLAQYTETRKLLHDSHEQNVQMSHILEKMRENEKCLVGETEKLRKFGAIQDLKCQQKCIPMDTISNLEKEVKYWQREAEKMSQIVELNDKQLQLTTAKPSKKKTSKQMKRYNRVINRSHSVENSQRKSKEIEFAKLKNEKDEMKNLLNDLEQQVVEIQNNVIKISEERQKYKDFYYSTKDKLARTENINVNLERKMCDSSNETSKLLRENKTLIDDFENLRRDTGHLKITNENQLKEISKMKLQHDHEVQTLETKLSCLVKENHDLGVRSNNLKNSIESLEKDFKGMEQELQKTCSENKDYLKKISALENGVTDTQRELCDKSKYIELNNKKMDSMEEQIHKLQKSEGILIEKLDIKTKEINTSRTKEKEMENSMHNMKSSFSVHAVKLENHIQNAEQIISSKIKLITSLELKVANDDKELKVRDEEILHLKKLFNSKEHELEISSIKFEESNEKMKQLEHQMDNLSSDHKTANREVGALNEVIKELKSREGLLKTEIKSLKEALNHKEDHILVVETQIERQNKEIPLKTEEISRYKKMISQLENEIDQKESHIGSLLSLLESKEEKLLSIQRSNEVNERKVKEYVDQLNNHDDSVIQSTARNNALENEIETLQNNNIRLTRQKEHLSQMLSTRNISIGQLQAQLADKYEQRRMEKITIIDDFPEYDDDQKYDGNLYSPSKLSRRNRSNDGINEKFDTSLHLNKSCRTQPSFHKRLADNYDHGSSRNRTHSHDGRTMKIINVD